MGKISLLSCQNYDGQRKSMEVKCWCGHSLPLLPIFPLPFEFLTLSFHSWFQLSAPNAPCPPFKQNPLGFGVTSPLDVLPIPVYKSYVPTHCDRHRNPLPRSPARKKYGQQVVSSYQLLQGQPKLQKTTLPRIIALQSSVLSKVVT